MYHIFVKILSLFGDQGSETDRTDRNKQKRTDTDNKKTETDRSGQKQPETIRNRQKKTETDRNGQKWTERTEKDRNGQNDAWIVCPSLDQGLLQWIYLTRMGRNANMQTHKQ